MDAIVARCFQSTPLTTARPTAPRAPAPRTGLDRLFDDTFIDDRPAARARPDLKQAPKLETKPKADARPAAKPKSARQALREGGVVVRDKGGAAIVGKTMGNHDAPKDIKDGVKDRPLTPRDVERVKRAFDKIKPVLDAVKRAGGIQPFPPQVVGVNKTIDQKVTKEKVDGKMVSKVKWELSDSTLGELLIDPKPTVVLTGKHLREISDKFAEFTLIHELMHFYLGHLNLGAADAFYPESSENPFVKAYDKAVKGEEAPTRYGGKNIDEDLADSATLYLLYPHLLKKLAPKRFEFFKKYFTPSKGAYGKDESAPIRLRR